MIFSTLKLRQHGSEPVAVKPEIWKTMVAEWPAYDDYQEQTSREIPVVVLERAG